MSKSPPKQQVAQYRDLINGVAAGDLARAREAVAKGVMDAQEQWIPNHIIVSALAMELQACVAGDQASNEIADYLRELADWVGEDTTNVEFH